MSGQQELQNIKQVVTGIERNPLANFAYTNAAFNADDVNGKLVFDVIAANNIPKESCTDYNSTILEKGLTTQGASIPRRAWNHFIGRTSYNLNKLVQKTSQLISHVASDVAHNCHEYDPYAAYQQGDCCYVVHQEAGLTMRTIFKRIRNDPDKIAGIFPMQQGQVEWVAIPNSEVVHLQNTVISMQQTLTGLESGISYILWLLTNIFGFLGIPVLSTEEGDVIATEEGYSLSLL